MLQVRNIAPQGRKAGRRSREQVEKDFLAQRTGGFQHHDPSTIQRPFEVLPTASGFMSDAERFHSDTAGDEKKRRDLGSMRKRQQIAAKRRERLERDEQRWMGMEREYVGDKVRLEKIRDKGTKFKNNKISVPYDPITMKYDQSDEGSKLKYKDELVMYRAELRKESIQRRRDGDFNPITGAPVQRVHVPPPPQQPVIIPKHKDYNQRYRQHTHNFPSHDPY